MDRIADLARSMVRLSGLTEKTAENPGGDIEIKAVGLRPGEEKLVFNRIVGLRDSWAKEVKRG